MDERENAPLFFIGQMIQHKYHGRGRIVGLEDPFWVVQFQAEFKKIPKNYREMEVIETDTDPEYHKIQRALKEVLSDYGWIETEFEVGKRWIGGTLTMTPGTAGAQSKDIPIEAFIKKIIGVREKLRVLEQKINNHPVLDNADKLELEGYITRCYGSLTTFNVLFQDKGSHFKGSSSSAKDELSD